MYIEDRLKSDGFRFAERTHFFHLEPALKTVSIIHVPTFQLNTLGSSSQIILTNRTMFIRILTNNSLKFQKLLLSESLRNLTNFLSQF